MQLLRFTLTFVIFGVLCRELQAADTDLIDSGLSEDPKASGWETTTTRDRYSTCGQTIRSTSQYIYYKHQTYYDSNERCVWVIAPDQANYFTFSVELNPVRPDGDGLLITTVQRSNSNKIANHFINGTGRWEFSGEMMILTFFSNSNKEFEVGFILVFSVSSQVRRPLPWSYIDSSTLEWPNATRERHPPYGDIYENNGLASFIYSPYFQQDSHQKHVRLSGLNLQNCNCCDAIHVYKFSENNRWELHPNSTICGGSASVLDIYSDDMLLLLFTTDSSGAGSPFFIEFSVEPTTSTTSSEIPTTTTSYTNKPSTALSTSDPTNTPSTNGSTTTHSNDVPTTTPSSSTALILAFHLNVITTVGIFLFSSTM